MSAATAVNGGTGADDDEQKRLEEEAMREADRLEEERQKQLELEELER